MTPLDKIQDVARQIDVMVSNSEASLVLHCPFCGLDSSPATGAVLCCDNLAEVVAALLDQIEFKKNMTVLNGIRDQLDAAERRPKVIQ